MDIEDRRRYFIVGSVILEIVQPLFRSRLENEYISKGLGSFQDFLNSQPIIHILFHLRHRNTDCCKDTINCYDNSKLPLIYCQWNLLYTESPGQRGHNCHCKFTANQVQLNDLDISLAGLILLNCCNLAPADDNAVHKLRRYKNDYLSHNTEGKISETEYKSLWTNLTNFILQIDPKKQNDLNRIENRPLDEGLCSKYSIDLLNIHKKLNEMDTTIQGISSTVHGIDSSIQKLLSYHRKETTSQNCKKKLNEQGSDERKVNPYKLGQDIFYLHHQIDLKSVLNTRWIEIILDEVMMDDGRLVICVLGKRSLLICNITGSQVAEIPVKDEPLCVTAIDTSTVAVIVRTDYSSYCDVHSYYIDIYDINQKNKMKSIAVPGLDSDSGITMLKNKLVVGGEGTLLIVDYITGETVLTIETDGPAMRYHASGDNIYYSKCSRKNSLCCTSLTDYNIHTLTLPSSPCSMTTLQDGSMYVLCEDGSVHHVSSDMKQFKTLETSQSFLFINSRWIKYNSKQIKLITDNGLTGIVEILQEKESI